MDKGDLLELGHRTLGYRFLTDSYEGKPLSAERVQLVKARYELHRWMQHPDAVKPRYSSLSDFAKAWMSGISLERIDSQGITELETCVTRYKEDRDTLRDSLKDILGLGNDFYNNDPFSLGDNLFYSVVDKSKLSFKSGEKYAQVMNGYVRFHFEEKAEMDLLVGNTKRAIGWYFHLIKDNHIIPMCLVHEKGGSSIETEDHEAQHHINHRHYAVPSAVIDESLARLVTGRFDFPSIAQNPFYSYALNQDGMSQATAQRLLRRIEDDVKKNIPNKAYDIEQYAGHLTYHLIDKLPHQIPRAIADFAATPELFIP